MCLLLFGLSRLVVATYRTKFGFKLIGLNQCLQLCPWISPIYYQSWDIDNVLIQKISEKRQFFPSFLFFANNSIMKGLPYSIEEKSKKKFWALNNLCNANREAILSCLWPSGGRQKYNSLKAKNSNFFRSCQVRDLRISYFQGVVKFFKVPLWKCFSTDFGAKVMDQPSICHMISIWSSTVASKVRGSEINLIE